MTAKMVSIADLHLPPDFASWGLKSGALEVLKAAIERKEISVRDIAALIPPEIAKDRQRFSAFIATIGAILKSRETKVVADGEEAAYRERFPIKSASILRFETRLKSESSRGSALEIPADDEYVGGETNAPSTVKRKTRLLSRGEEQELGEKIASRQDLASRNKLVEHNLRLVHWMVKKKFRWALNKIEYDDLVGYGNEGLITAAERFQPSKGNKFSTYAFWWIRQRISRAITDEGDLIRIPVHMHEVREKIRSSAQRKAAELGRIPTLDEIAEEAELSKDQIKRVLQYMQFDFVSLDQETSISKGEGKEQTIGEMIPDRTTANPELILEAKQELAVAQRRVDEVLENIADMSKGSERNIEIFKALYGFDGSGRRRTLEVVGQQYKMSRERVRQIVAAIWQKISDRGSDMDHDQLLEELVRIDELGKIATSI